MTDRRTPRRGTVAATASVLALTAPVPAPLACTVRSGPAPAEVRQAAPAGAVGETVRTDAGLVRGARSGAHRIFFGAHHSGDIPYLFEDEAAEPLFTPAQRRLSATMTGYWAAFARTGAPRGAGLPAWLPHRPGPAGRPYTQSLAPRRIGLVDYRREHHLDFWNRMP
ncbi:hypothetical protein SUDANB176_00785 [Streptomyces sp. enrichment culture]|uniref:carboxylesterase family protein n=1 Tax=Streptomyces sp. enrichment culture TaxID=1795815 RepID=UPI003F55F624